MRLEEAEQIRMMIDGHWNLRMDTATSDMWLGALMPEDAEDTVKAVAELAKTMHYPPKIADLRDLLLKDKHDQAPHKTACPTCYGDKAVFVATRPVKQSLWMEEKGIGLPNNGGQEEYAPCPDCNTRANAKYRRHDGTYFHPHDPSRVREMMKG